MFNLSRFKRAKILGYESKKLIDHVVRRSQRYRSSLQSTKKIDPGLSSVLMAVFLSALRSEDKQLKIIDFGGGSGHLKDTLSFLYPNQIASYTIIETNAMVEANLRRNIKDIEFVTLSEFSTLNHSNIDLLIMNSSLQYLENPLNVLEHLLNETNPKFLFIGKTPFHDSTGCKKGIQQSLLSSNGPKGDSTSTNELVEYEVHILPFLQFQTVLDGRWELLYEMDSDTLVLKSIPFFREGLYATKSILYKNCVQSN